MPPDLCNMAAMMEAGDYSLAAWVAVVRVYNKLVRRLERRLDEHGLCLPHFEVLMKLASAEGMTQQELAQKLLVTKGNVCTLLDRMESSGWVERRAHPEDRRANRLFLTAAGRKLLDAAVPDHLEMVREAMSTLAPAGCKSVYESLGRIDRALVLE